MKGHQTFDIGWEKAKQQNNVKLTCCKGCSACCSEPLYAFSTEVEGMWNALTEKQREEVAINAGIWLERFRKTNAGSYSWDNLMPAHEYLALRIPCPFLKDGLCMAYEHRPIACRDHCAVGPAINCEPENRRKQRYVRSVEVLEAATAQLAMESMAQNGAAIADHLGLLLAELITRERHASEARKEVVNNV